MSSGKNRAAQARALARKMTEDHGVPVTAEYYPSDRWWVFTWSDGPTQDTMKKALTAAGHTFARPDWTSEVQRNYSDRALTLTAIRMAAAGENFGKHNIYNIQHHHRNTEHPQRCDDREAAMADRLMAASEVASRSGHAYFSENQMADLVAERGIGWLLETPSEQPGQPEVDLSDRATVLGLLTARYATGRQAEDWKRRGQTMGLREAVYAATADPGLVDPRLTLAVLTLIPDFVQELHDEARRIKTRAVTAARRADNHWDQIGAAQGTSKQAAQKWAAENGIAAIRARGPVDPRAVQVVVDLKSALDAGATWEEMLSSPLRERGGDDADMLWHTALDLYDEVYPEAALERPTTAHQAASDRQRLGTMSGSS